MKLEKAFPPYGDIPGMGLHSLVNQKLLVVVLLVELGVCLGATWITNLVISAHRHERRGQKVEPDT